MTALRTLIVDDEPLAREGLSDYVNQVDFLTEVGQAREGLEALHLLKEHPVDLLLLDIQMPGLSGLDLIRTLRQPPLVILTTAHPSFAVEGFELDVVDYLLKPITFPRFLRAALRAQSRHGGPAAAPAAPANPAAPEAEDHFFVRVDNRVERIRFAEIRYLEAMQNYVRIHTDRGAFLPLLTLKSCLAALPADRFLQVHKSYAVQLARVTAFEGNELHLGEATVPVSRSRRAEVEQRLLGGRLL
jgi:DNA-binding LytR/AlgR family response regulator